MDLPTERTPLLHDGPGRNTQPRLPCVSSIEKAVNSPEEGLAPYSPQLITRRIQDYTSHLPSEAAGFALTILVCLRYLSSLDGDVQTRRTEMETFIVEKWKELKAIDFEAVHSALWLPYPLDEEGKATQTRKYITSAPHGARLSSAQLFKRYWRLMLNVLRPYLLMR